MYSTVVLYVYHVSRPCYFRYFRWDSWVYFCLILRCDNDILCWCVCLQYDAIAEAACRSCDEVRQE